MMRVILISYILLFIFGCSNQTSHKDNFILDSNKISPDDKYDLAYCKVSDSSDDNSPYVFVVNFNSNKKLCFKQSCKPVLSPDGKKLLMTKTLPSEKNCRVIVDLNTKEEHEFKPDVDYTFSETWSPDAKYIAYHAGYCKIGISKSDLPGSILLDFSSEKDIFEPTWTSDGNYILTGDVFNVYKIGVKPYSVDTILNGKELIKDTCIFGMSGHVCLTSDNKYLIFSADINERLEGNVPPFATALFAYDLNLKKIDRLTPKGLSSSDPHLGIDDEIFFSGITDFKKQMFAIYKVNIKDKKITKIIEHGWYPTTRYKD